MLLAILVGGCSSPAPASATGAGSVAPAAATSEPLTGFDHTHGAFDAVLQQVVSDGTVDYGALAGSRGALDGYLASLAAVSVDQLAGFEREQAMALWINAYNALTLALILDNGPLESIREIEEPWDRPKSTVAGRTLSLNQIEHEILRAQYPDARLHMVLVCAALSCPKLSSRAYAADRLEAQLDEASRGFAGDTARNRFDPDRGVLAVSRIFEWYGADFVKQYAERGGGDDEQAAIRGFFASHLPDESVVRRDLTIEWLEYDWALNGSF